MDIWCLDVTIKPKNTVYYKDALESITRLIDKAIVITPEDADFHQSKAFKFYSHSNLWPIEEQKEYLAGKEYKCQIRTIKLDVYTKLLTNMIGLEHNGLVVKEISCSKLTPCLIDKLYTLTGCYVTYKDTKYWRENKSIFEFIESLSSNLIHKYESFYGVTLDSKAELFSAVNIKNNKPLFNKVKDCYLPTDKLELTIAPNKQAQSLAWFAIATGIGEKNTRGLGFVDYTPIRSV